MTQIFADKQSVPIRVLRVISVLKVFILLYLNAPEGATTNAHLSVIRAVRSGLGRALRGKRPSRMAV
jgi:hypothetical protein